MGLNIKKDVSLISLEGEVRKDGQDNPRAYPVILFNIIYIMRTYAHVGEIWATEHHHGLVLLSLVRLLVFDRHTLKSLLRPLKEKTRLAGR